MGQVVKYLIVIRQGCLYNFTADHLFCFSPLLQAHKLYNKSDDGFVGIGFSGSKLLCIFIPLCVPLSLSPFPFQTC